MAVFSSLVILSQTASIRISIACIEKKKSQTWYDMNISCMISSDKAFISTQVRDSHGNTMSPF